MVVEQAAAIGLKEAPSVFRSLWRNASTLISKVDFLNFAKRYRSFLLDNYSKIKILGMEEPRSLRDVYTELRFLKEIPSRKYQSFEEMEERAQKSVENWQRSKIELRVGEKIENDLRMERLKEELAHIDLRFEIEREKLHKNLTGEELEKALRKSTRSQERERKQMRETTAASQLDQRQMLEKSNRFQAELDLALGEAIEQELAKAVQDYVSPLSTEDVETLSAKLVLADRQRLMVLGKPGAGKSTFLKHVLLSHLDGEIDQPKLPLMVVLREYADSKFNSILDFLASDFEDSSFADPKPFLERILRKSDAAILLLDGLDEVPANSQSRVLDEIGKLSKKFRGSQIIVSSRIATYRGQLDGFSEFELSDLKMQDIRDFAGNWFGQSEKLFTAFMKDIARNRGLRELTTTPLLLTILCVSYKRNLRFPEQRSLLYLNCIDTIFIDWDSSRQIRRPRYLEHFDVESKKFVLGKFASDTFCDRMLLFYKKEMIDLLQNAGTSLPSDLNKGDLMLKEFVEHHGIILERSKGIFSFSHLTFQEFFNALHISNHPSRDRYITLIELFFSDERWRETILFLGGLLPVCDDLLHAIIHVAKSKVSSSSSVGLVLRDHLPGEARIFLKRPERSGHQEYWRAWFLCRMTEYRLSSVNRDAVVPSSRQIYWRPMSGMARAIQALGELDKGRDLTMSRPMNRVLSKCYESIEDDGSASEVILNDLPVWEKYFELVELGLGVLESRARCTPEFRAHFVQDLFRPSSESINLATNPEGNALGI